MKQILIQLMFLAPAVIEALVIDPYFWKKKKSDKPITTIGRGIVIVLIGLFTQLVLKDNWMVLAMLGVIVWYVAIFNYLINWKLGVHPGYKQNWWIFGNPFVKALLLIIFIIIYLTFNSTINESANILFDIQRFR